MINIATIEDLNELAKQVDSVLGTRIAELEKRITELESKEKNGNVNVIKSKNPV